MNYTIIDIDLKSHLFEYSGQQNMEKDFENVQTEKFTTWICITGTPLSISRYQKSLYHWHFY